MERVIEYLVEVSSSFIMFINVPHVYVNSYLSSHPPGIPDESPKARAEEPSRGVINEQGEARRGPDSREQQQPR